MQILVTDLLLKLSSNSLMLQPHLTVFPPEKSLDSVDEYFIVPFIAYFDAFYRLNKVIMQHIRFISDVFFSLSLSLLNALQNTMLNSEKKINLYCIAQ